MFYTTEFQLGNTDSQVIQTSPAIILVRISEGHLNTYSIYIYIYVYICLQPPYFMFLPIYHPLTTNYLKLSSLSNSVC